MKLKAVEVAVENAPSQWCIVTGIWGQPALAVCDSQETAERLVRAANKENPRDFALSAAVNALRTATETLETFAYHAAFEGEEAPEFNEGGSGYETLKVLRAALAPTPMPGEWEVINDHTITVQSGPDGATVARFFGDDAEANAALLVAARDMRAALATLVGMADLGEVDLDDDEKAALEIARAALAKAKDAR